MLGVDIERLLVDGRVVLNLIYGRIGVSVVLGRVVLLRRWLLNEEIVWGGGDWGGCWGGMSRRRGAVGLVLRGVEGIEAVVVVCCRAGVSERGVGNGGKGLAVVVEGVVEELIDAVHGIGCSPVDDGDW